MEKETFLITFSLVLFRTSYVMNQVSKRRLTYTSYYNKESGELINWVHNFCINLRILVWSLVRVFSHLEDLGLDWRIILNSTWNKYAGDGVDWISLSLCMVHCWVVVIRNFNEPSSFMKCRQFFDLMTMKHTNPWAYLVT